METHYPSYFTHAGLPSGIVEIGPNDIKGFNPGKYLNIYRESGVAAKEGDITKLNEYFTWLLGKENWLVTKQYLAFMLKEPGVKIQWFNIWHSVTQGVGKKLFSQICQRLFGPSNVKPNVAFKQLTTGHSTVIEGAQMIFLNEVVLTNSTGDRKEMSEEFKNFITDDNLIINPKNKPQIEVPNLCNFFVFSNSETPLHITSKDRRAYVTNIDCTEEQVEEMLENNGYKEEVLKILRDPSAFKWHLENEIEYDRNMFFQRAPMNEDKKQLIEKNKSDFVKIMDEAFEDQSFPFGNLISGTEHNPIHYTYKGVLHTLDLYKFLKASTLFKGIYFKIDTVEDYIKSICTPWDDKKTLTKQAKTPLGKRVRLYCVEPQWKVKDKPILELTEGELGALWVIEPGKDNDLGKYARELPNYEELTFNKEGEEKKEYKNHCWSCKIKDEETGKYVPTPIDSDECDLCPNCNYGYNCSKCGVCECAKPDSKIRKAQEKFQRAWDSRKGGNY